MTTKKYQVGVNMQSNELTLWGIGTVRQMRPHWMLLEMGLEYEFHPTHPRSGQTYELEFLKLNPRHKVPVLRHGAFVLTESAAITLYVSEAFKAPTGIYVPQDAVGRAKVNEWCYFIMSELDAHTLYIMRRHGALKSLYGDAPVAITAAREYFIDQFNAVASRIGAEGRYLFGEDLSAADIILTTTLDWAIEYDLPLPDCALEYRSRVAARPAYQEARKRTFPVAV